MLLDLLLLGGGLLLLVFAADHFVLGASRLARALAMPPVVIGAVVMGFGTSAPEMLVSTIAAAKGDLDLGVGNVVGSNVANLSLVLGLAGLVTALGISSAVLKKEGVLSILASAAFALVVIDGRIERWEGAALMVGLVCVVAYLVWSGASEEADDELEASTTTSREVGRVLTGLVGTVAGAQMLVTGATDLADTWGFTGGFIGFSLVALGTSLPELVTTLACARRNEAQLIVGNLLGSNIFNSLAVGGGIGLVGPGLIGDASLSGLGIGLMMVVAVGSFVMAVNGKMIGRADGVILLVLYVASMAALGVTNDPDGAESLPVACVSECE